MTIPKTFSLFGHQYRVVLDDSVREDGAAAAVDTNTKVIRLVDGKKNDRARTYIEQTFLHEVSHAIFTEMAERDLANNEKFIDLFASALHQYITTSKGEIHV